MKKFFAIIFCLMLWSGLLAQSFDLSMGLGLSQQLRSSYPRGEQGLRPLWTLNSAFARDFRLWKSVYLRAELAYYQQGILYDSTFYNETFHYLGWDNFLLFRSYSSPVYFGIGGFTSILAAVSGSEGDNEFALRRTNYVLWDYGLLPVIGFVIDFDFISYYAEMRYRFGMNDIAPSAGLIKNRGFEFNLGVSLRIR